MTTIREAARDTRVRGTHDVIVCGAGPAGVGAAIAAARTGAQVLLIEALGCLGGVWTAGLLCWILDVHNKAGLLPELKAALAARGALGTIEPENYAFDPEVMKQLLEALCLEAGVAVRLLTRVVDVIVEGGEITHVITESKAGREAWRGRVVVDASGDGDVAARAGCGYDVGHPETGQVQPMSLLAVVAGPEVKAIRPFVCWKEGIHRAAKQRFLAEIERAGVSPSYAAPTLFDLGRGLYSLVVNHEYGVSALDPDAITAATMRGRAEVHRITDALRGLGGPWSSLRLVATADQIGVREARRIHGLHTVTVDEMLAGARHEDAVCRVNFGIDVHSTDPDHSKGFGADNKIRTQPYDVPLRALIARDVGGLLMAGRCISGDFLAHSSYRVTGESVPMGEAAGVLAAIASRTGCAPADVPWPQVAVPLKAFRAAYPAEQPDAD